MQKKKSVAVNIKNAKTLNLKRFIYTCNNEHDINNIFVDNITLSFYDVHTQILTLTHIHLNHESRRKNLVMMKGRETFRLQCVFNRMLFSL